MLDRPRSLRPRPPPSTERAESALPELLRPELLAGLKRLDLRAKIILNGLRLGTHRAARRGFSAEFSDYREFTPGDDPRRIDWRLYARTDRLYLKRYESESALRAVLVLDASASMGYCSETPALSKLEYAATLAAALAFMLQRQRDRVGLLRVAGSSETSATKLQREKQNSLSGTLKRVWRNLSAAAPAHGDDTKEEEFSDEYFPPRSSRVHGLRLLRELSALRPAGRADLAGALDALAARERKRGLIAIFSDALCSPAPLLDALRKLRQRGHEIIFFVVRDPAEFEPRIEPGYAFRDPESRQSFEPLDPAEYRRRVQAHWSELRGGMLAAGIDVQALSTTSPFDRALLRFLKLRERRS